MTCDLRARPRILRDCIVAIVVLSAGGCVSPSQEGTREYLDETTAVTVTVASGELVFARERPDLAVHARDYLTLVPIDVNRAGTHRQYFYGFVWSTIDKRGSRADDAPSGRFEIVADDRLIPLVPVIAPPRQLGLAEPPVRAPSRSARLVVAETDHETLGFLATASSIRAILHENGLDESYELWTRSPGSLLALR